MSQTSKVVKPLITDEEIDNYIDRLQEVNSTTQFNVLKELCDRYESHLAALESQAMRFSEWTNIHEWSYDGVSEYWTRYKEDGNLETITTQELFTDFKNETNLTPKNETE